MFFDDRLATVLRQRATSEAGARTQYRQLLDILGNRKFSSTNPDSQSLAAAAWLRMDKLAEEIPAEQRAAMIRETGWRFRSADLAAHLADHEPDVAAAALTRAQLSADDWSALIPRLPIRARGFLRLRRDLPVDTEALLERLGVHDRGLPRPGEQAGVSYDIGPPGDMTLPKGAEDPAANRSEAPLELQAEDEETAFDRDQDLRSDPEFDPDETGRSEISALVERIAQFRRNRDLTPTDTERSPRLPLGEMPQTNARLASGFGFKCDASGRIDWAESPVASMVIGTRITQPKALGSRAQKPAIERAFARRQPIIRAQIKLEGAESITGNWIVDAQPAFSDDGNFTGYVGRFRREAEIDPAHSPAAREADRLRQLLHELRTPVTAVQGYAEVIQQQLFGPAPHEYRALAAAIAADAARILAGFEELDRLAKMETGALGIEEGESDIGALTERHVTQIGQVLRSRMAGIDLVTVPETPVTVPIDKDDAEALLWRLLATLGGACASGEMLEAQFEHKHNRVLLNIDLPAQLIAEEDAFTADVKPVGNSINAGLFGAGFTLRLARAEARAAGGDLAIDEDMVTLSLPLLTGEETLPSQEEVDKAGGNA